MPDHHSLWMHIHVEALEGSWVGRNTAEVVGAKVEAEAPEVGSRLARLWVGVEVEIEVAVEVGC